MRRRRDAAGRDDPARGDAAGTDSARGDAMSAHDRPDAEEPGAEPLLLQRYDAEEGCSLWDQALPLRHWRRVLGRLPLTAEVEGPSAVLMASVAGERRVLETGGSGVRLVPASLEADWLWFEGDVRTVRWTVPRIPRAAAALPRVSVVMPTLRRESAALAQARAFLAMPQVREVIVVDQGGTLADHPDMARLRAEHAGLRLITQQNLGGSGGYARGMLEAAAHPEDAVLLSDDDAAISEESLRRMLLLQTLSPQRTIVGTPLFDAERPGRLLAHAEAVSPQDFQWRASDGVHERVDLRGTDPAEWTFLVETTPPNYTGWWGTLLPPGTTEELGLPAPFFLKWDDAEYGLRATRRGYRHAVLPGTSVRHPSWNAHRTQMAWPARILHRNRLTTAAVHGSGRRVVLSSLLHQFKHVLAGHHLTATLWESGIDSFLAGPESWLGSDIARARADSQQVVLAWRADHPLPDALPPATESLPGLLPCLLRAIVLLLRRQAPERRRVRRVSAEALRWRSTLGADAVVVTDAQGRGVDELAPMPAEGRALLRRTLASHARLALAWPRLARRYRGAMPRRTRAEAWIPLFEGACASPAADRRRGPWTPEPTP